MVQTVDLFGGTFAVSKAGLAAGTTTTTTTVAVTYAIRGKAYTASASTNGATPTTDAITGEAFVAIPVGKSAVFVFGLNAAGQRRVVQSKLYDLKENTITDALEFPAIPDDFCPIGYEIVAVKTGGSPWTMGTSNQATLSNVEKIFVDVLVMPDRPQAS